MKLHHQQGFTLLELVVVLIIISGLLAFAFDRLLKLEVQAERAAMEQVIGNLKSALALTIGKHIATDDIPGLRKYLDTNPMDLLADTPPTYLGSYVGQPPKLANGANWYYDQSSQSLVYVTGNPAYFQSEGTEKSVTRLKILPVYDDKNGNGRFDAGDSLAGLKLAATAPYHWQNEPIKPAEYTTTAKR